MRIADRASHAEVTTTAQKLHAEKAAIQIPGVETLGQPAKILTGPAAAQHYIRTERASARPAPRTVRTTRTGRRVVMRQTGRLA